jgi:DNA-binding transcriptional ArsR family regulator
MYGRPVALVRSVLDLAHTKEVIDMAEGLRTLVEQLKAVSHPIRLRVLALLESGELCVCQIAETLQVPQSSVSEALRELRRAGFVVERKEGRWVFMSVVPKNQVTPLLKGILTEARTLLAVQEDRARANEVKELAIPVVCSKVQRGSSAGREVARV